MGNLVTGLPRTVVIDDSDGDEADLPLFSNRDASIDSPTSHTGSNAADAVDDSINDSQTLRRSSRPRKHAFITAVSPPSQPTEKKLKAPTTLMATLHVGRGSDEVAHIIGDPVEPFWGLLKGSDADIGETRPRKADRKLFERYSEPNMRDPCSDSTPLRASDLSRIRRIHFGNVEIPTWYTSPYPEEYAYRECISICDRCLVYLPTDFVLARHRRKCQPAPPPGTEIYRDGAYSVFEVDGGEEPLYCQNLCLLAKLFLQSKTLYQDVQPFLFYVLIETTPTGTHFVGYFSKQKIHASREPTIDPTLNVSCIMAIPSAQNRGFGQFLIDFSYLLTSVQRTVGTPEKPLSSLGLKSYTSYWKRRLCYIFRDGSRSNLSIRRISELTGMTIDDVVFTLDELGWLKRITPPTIEVDYVEIGRRIRQWESRKPLLVDPKRLLWVPPAPW